MRRLGQHFLKNNSAIEKIVAALELSVGETIVEIGPGHGELTFPLLEACKEKDCRIIAIEKDEELARKLVSYAARELRNVEIINGDVLKMLPALTRELTSLRAYELVGNIPYYITGHLLRIIGELERKPARCVFTIQREVAERITAMPPRMDPLTKKNVGTGMNRLAASVQFWAEPEIVGFLGKNDFSPTPEVESAIILLKIKDKKSRIKDEYYYRAVRMLFAQPRKTILNNVAAKNAGAGVGKEEIAEKLKSLGIDPEKRPQDLSVEEISLIAGSF